MTDNPIIQADLTAYTRSVKRIRRHDWPFHVVNGFAEIAEEAEHQVQALTRQKFNIHSDYIIKGIRHTPRTKGQKAQAMRALKKYGDFNAAVYLRPSMAAKNSLQFMADHETGEQRNAVKRQIAIPLAGVKKRAYQTARGRVRKRWKPATLLKRYKEAGSAFDGRTTTNKGRKLGPRRKRVPGAAFLIKGRGGQVFIARRHTNKGDNQLDFMYLLKPQTRIKIEWGFVASVYGSVFVHSARILTKHINKLPDYDR